MADKKWRVDVAGQAHEIELQTGSFMGGGKLIMDGKEVKKWGTSISGLPPIKFEVQDKKAEVKGKGFMANTPVLYLDGKEVPLPGK
jgi:hypothetical protein